jgi:hypothetical protein
MVKKDRIKELEKENKQQKKTINRMIKYTDLFLQDMFEHIDNIERKKEGK